MCGHETLSDSERLATIEKKLQEMPNNITLLLEKSILLYEPFHQTEDAIRIFEYIIQLDPGNVDAYFWWAECIADHNANYPQAVPLLKKALQIDNQRGDCHFLLASVLSELEGDKNEIEFHVKKAIELEPSWISPRIFLAGYLLKNKAYAQAKYEVEVTLQYILPEIPLVTDPIIDHYETKVTGRYHPDNKSICVELLKHIASL